MSKNAVIAIYLIIMIITIVTLDVAFFRHQFKERLMANIAIVLLFIAFYLRFFK
jgi:ABC-type transport system involved in cytochrome c biogenesis permease subunit